MYYESLGVLQDYQKAAFWYGKAAEQGDAAAQNNLAIMYQLGNGVRQDYRQARSWYEKAAEQGDAAAQTNLRILVKEMQ